MCHRTAGFYNVLSVSVVPSMSVESATCLMKCFFCAVFLSGTMRSAMFVLLEETAFRGDASLEPADPSTADFLENLTAACPRSVSSSSSALIFEVLRDSQILGSGRLKKVPKNAPKLDSTFN